MEISGRPGCCVPVSYKSIHRKNTIRASLWKLVIPDRARGQPSSNSLKAMSQDLRDSPSLTAKLRKQWRRSAMDRRKKLSDKTPTLFYALQCLSSIQIGIL